MRFLMYYPQVLWLSLSTASFYRQVLRANLKPALAFFSLTILLSSLASILVWRILTFPTFYARAQAESTHLLASLPDSFSLQYRDGTLSFYGVGLPFLLYPSKDLPSQFPKALIQLGESEKREALLELGSQELWINSPDRVISTQTGSLPYREFLDEDFTLTKSQMSDSLKRELMHLPQSVTILSVIGFPFLWLFKMISTGFHVLLYSLIFQTLAWVLGIRLTYIKSLQVGLHIGAISSLIAVVGSVIAPYAGFSLFTGSYIAILCVVLWEFREKRVE